MNLLPELNRIIDDYNQDYCLGLIAEKDTIKLVNISSKEVISTKKFENNIGYTEIISCLKSYIVYVYANNLRSSKCYLVSIIDDSVKETTFEFRARSNINIYNLQNESYLPEPKPKDLDNSYTLYVVSDDGQMKAYMNSFYIKIYQNNTHIITIPDVVITYMDRRIINHSWYIQQNNASDILIYNLDLSTDTIPYNNKRLFLLSFDHTNTKIFYRDTEKVYLFDLINKNRKEICYHGCDDNHNYTVTSSESGTIINLHNKMIVINQQGYQIVDLSERYNDITIL